MDQNRFVETRFIRLQIKFLLEPSFLFDELLRGTLVFISPLASFSVLLFGGNFFSYSCKVGFQSLLVKISNFVSNYSPILVNLIFGLHLHYKNKPFENSPSYFFHSGKFDRLCFEEFE
eukprot:Sdes_comp15755_c1_seq1m4808